MTHKKIHDVTLPVDSHLPVWPEDPAVILEQTTYTTADITVTSSRIRTSLHVGTHIDAPYHFNPQGWTIDQIPFDILMGLVQVVEVPDSEKITRDILTRLNIENTSRLFFKTRNSFFWNESPLCFHPEFTAFTEDAALFLKNSGTQLVGIDYLSIDLFTAEDLPVHRILCRENIVGVEGLDLRHVKPGTYECICLR